jgi:hypothetical protein
MIGRCFLTIWQCLSVHGRVLRGGDNFLSRRHGVAERGRLEVAGMSFRDHAGDQGLIGGVTVGRHVVMFSFACAVSSG